MHTRFSFGEIFTVETKHCLSLFLFHLPLSLLFLLLHPAPASPGRGSGGSAGTGRRRSWAEPWRRRASRGELHVRHYSALDPRAPRRGGGGELVWALPLATASSTAPAAASSPGSDALFFFIFSIFFVVFC